MGREHARHLRQQRRGDGRRVPRRRVVPRCERARPHPHARAARRLRPAAAIRGRAGAAGRRARRAADPAGRRQLRARHEQGQLRRGHDHPALPGRLHAHLPRRHRLQAAGAGAVAGARAAADGSRPHDRRRRAVGQELRRAVLQQADAARRRVPARDGVQGRQRPRHHAPAGSARRVRRAAQGRGRARGAGEGPRRAALPPGRRQLHAQDAVGQLARGEVHPDPGRRRGADVPRHHRAQAAGGGAAAGARDAAAHPRPHDRRRAAARRRAEGEARQPRRRALPQPAGGDGPSRHLGDRGDALPRAARRLRPAARGSRRDRAHGGGARPPGARARRPAGAAPRRQRRLGRDLLHRHPRRRRADHLPRHHQPEAARARAGRGARRRGRGVAGAGRDDREHGAGPGGDRAGRQPAHGQPPRPRAAAGARRHAADGPPLRRHRRLPAGARGL